MRRNGVMMANDLLDIHIKGKCIILIYVEYPEK